MLDLRYLVWVAICEVQRYNTLVLPVFTWHEALLVVPSYYLKSQGLSGACCRLLDWVDFSRFETCIAINDMAMKLVLILVVVFVGVRSRWTIRELALITSHGAGFAGWIGGSYALSWSELWYNLRYWYRICLTLLADWMRELLKKAIACVDWVGVLCIWGVAGYRLLELYQQVYCGLLLLER